MTRLRENFKNSFKHQVQLCALCLVSLVSSFVFANVASAGSTSTIKLFSNQSACLDTQGGGVGGLLYSQSCNGSQNQNFVFTKQADGNYVITSSAGLCLDPGSNPNGFYGTISPLPCSGASEQEWQLIANADGSQSITSVLYSGQGVLEYNYAGGILIIGPLSSESKLSEFLLPGASGSSSPPATPPSVSLLANPISVASGGSTSLTWSSANATSCTASGAWSGAQPLSGTQTFANLTSTATYALTCQGAGGSASQSAIVTVSTGSGSSLSSGSGSGSSSSSSSVPAPPQAQAAGFTKLIFDDELNSLNMSPNGCGTYNWYNGIWYEGPSSASDITVSSSVLTLTETPSDPHDTTITTFNRCGGPSTLFNYGYFEARLNWNTIPENWAVFWLFSNPHALGTDAIPGGNEWCELDIFEGFQASVFVGTVHDWVLSGGAITNKQNTNNWQPLSGVDMSQWHTYGVLWTPSVITWYLDNQAIMSWPTPAICQTQQLFMLLGAQVHPPQTSNVYTNVDWVRVWH